MTVTLKPDLAAEVWGSAEDSASACMNCGVCSAICPIDSAIAPRMLFRHVLLGMEDRVLEETEAIYSCLLCKLCEVNCPAEVPITAQMRALRHYINHKVFSL